MPSAPWEKDAEVVSEAPEAGGDEWKATGEAIKAALAGGGKEQMSARDMASMGMGGAAANPMVQHAHDNPEEAVADTAMMAAGPLAGPVGGAVRAVAGRASPALMRALPRVESAVSGAAQGGAVAGPWGAVAGGVVGAVTGKGPTELIAGGIRNAAKGAQAARAASTAVPAVAEAVEATAPAGLKLVKSIPNVTKDVAELITSTAPRADMFTGPKIHFLLDKSGKAVKLLTPGEAGAVSEGLKAWVKNSPEIKRMIAGGS